MANDIEMRTRSPGGAIWPRRNNPATGGAYDPYRIPCFTAEITGGLLIASHMSLPCLPADPIFHLPLGAITSVQIRGAGEEAELFDAVSRWARLCCWHRIGSAEATLVLDVDAPNGWLHHGWAGGPPGWAGPMLIKARAPARLSRRLARARAHRRPPNPLLPSRRRRSDRASASNLPLSPLAASSARRGRVDREDGRARPARQRVRASHAANAQQYSMIKGAPSLCLFIRASDRRSVPCGNAGCRPSRLAMAPARRCHGSWVSVRSVGAQHTQDGIACRVRGDRWYRIRWWGGCWGLCLCISLRQRRRGRGCPLLHLDTK
eukprot:7119598-Prymnesium_polylepis.2